MFLASLRTVVTILTNNAARIGPAVMMLSTFIRAELSLLSALGYFGVLSMGRIVTIIGTRPEIIKMAPVVKALDALDHDHVLVHSGQHYDLMMDRIFFRDMELREPNYRFELKEQPPHLQVATTMRQVATVAKSADLVIDALLQNLPIAEKRSDVLSRLGLTPGGYMILTFHRSENVDSKERLSRALVAFERAADEAEMPILFPIHPRTAKRLQEFGLEKRADEQASLRRIEPTGYLDMLILEKNAALVMTDSGRLQEESCFFRVPCVTLRENTERPETLEIGSNVLAGTDPERGGDAVLRQLDAERNWLNP